MFESLRSFAKGVGDSIEGAVESGLVTYVRPPLLAEANETVTEFRTKVEASVPDQVESSVKEMAAGGGNSAVSKMVSTILEGGAASLSQKLLVLFGPHLDTATAALGDGLTDGALEAVKDLLGLDDDEEEAAAAAAAAAGGEAAPAPLAAAEGGAGIQGKLDQIQEVVRGGITPITSGLHATLWDMVPAALQELIDEAFDDDDPEGAGEEAKTDDGDWVPDWLEKKMKTVLTASVPAMSSFIKEPVGKLITELIQWLETTIMDKAAASVKEGLAAVHLI